MYAPTLSVSCEASYRVCGLLGSLPVVLVVDRGSAVSLLREDVCTRLVATMDW